MQYLALASVPREQRRAVMHLGDAAAKRGAGLVNPLDDRRRALSALGLFPQLLDLLGSISPLGLGVDAFPA
jgi:hypothetical protein